MGCLAGSVTCESPPRSPSCASSRMCPSRRATHFRYINNKNSETKRLQPRFICKSCPAKRPTVKDPFFEFTLKPEDYVKHLAHHGGLLAIVQTYMVNKQSDNNILTQKNKPTGAKKLDNNGDSKRKRTPAVVEDPILADEQQSGKRHHPLTPTTYTMSSNILHDATVAYGYISDPNYMCTKVDINTLMHEEPIFSHGSSAYDDYPAQAPSTFYVEEYPSQDNQSFETQQSTYCTDEIAYNLNQNPIIHQEAGPCSKLYDDFMLMREVDLPDVPLNREQYEYLTLMQDELQNLINSGSNINNELPVQVANGIGIKEPQLLQDATEQYEHITEAEHELHEGRLLNSDSKAAVDHQAASEVPMNYGEYEFQLLRADDRYIS